MATASADFEAAASKAVELESAENRSNQTFRRRHTLRKSAEFVRCYRRGSRRRGSFLRVHWHRSDAVGEKTARLGITASRKVGKAVVRHRLKRRVREIFRRWERRSDLIGLDLVVHLEPAASDASFSALKSELEEMLMRVVKRAS